MQKSLHNFQPRNGRAVKLGSILLFFAFLIPGLFSCTEKPSSRVEQKPFFDLKKYFESEVQRLNGLLGIKKITSINGKREERIPDFIDFKQELDIFSKNDINRAAWTDKYAVDSLLDEKGHLLKLTYSANHEKLKTRLISIDFKEGAVSKIFIQNNASSAVAETSQRLTYLPKEGYSIESRQKVALASDNTFLIEVNFFEK